MAATTQVRLLVRTIVCDGLNVLSHACFPNKLSFDHLFTTQRTEHLARGKELELCTSPCPFLGLCTSSLRRGHANLLCIVPSFDKDPNRLCQSKLDSRSFDNIPLTGIWAQARKIKSRQKPAVPHTSFHQALRCLTSQGKKTRCSRCATTSRRLLESRKNPAQPYPTQKSPSSSRSPLFSEKYAFLDANRMAFEKNWTHWGLSPGPSACGADVIPLHHVPDKLHRAYKHVPSKRNNRIF